MHAKRFVAMGECMAELSPLSGDDFRMGFAGDTLNTLWYVQGISPDSKIHTRFVSAAGSDEISDRMVSFIASHGIETSHIIRHNDSTLGLYMITLDEGERSFTYWRGQSAARKLAADRNRLRSALADADLIFLSGITLAILDEAAREILLSEIKNRRTDGATVAFDSNIRPKMWASISEMREVLESIYRTVDIALPTFSDESMIFNDEGEEGMRARLKSYGVTEIVIKQGADPCIIEFEGKVSQVPAIPVLNVIDTTGAGDSFNGGYLASRLLGYSTLESASQAHRVSAAVIQKKGALLPLDMLIDFNLV